MKKTTLILLVVLIILATTAFDCNKKPSPDAGFNLHTRIAVFSGGFPVQLVQPDVELFGHWESDTDLDTGTILSTGTVKQISGKSDGAGFFAVPGGRRELDIDHFYDLDHALAVFAHGQYRNE